MQLRRLEFKMPQVRSGSDWAKAVSATIKQEFGVTIETMIAIMPDIPNYKKEILGPYSCGIEPRDEYYERKVTVSETKRCEETKAAIQRYMDELKRIEAGEPIVEQYYGCEKDA